MTSLRRVCFEAARASRSGLFSRSLTKLEESLRLSSNESAGATQEELSEAEKKLQDELEKLTKEASVVKERASELEDKYKRALAESENMRRRLTKQIEDAKVFGIQGFCKDLLEVADILARATESIPESELAKNNALKDLFKGLKMTESQLQAVFRRNGLTQINPIGEKFDPNMHEALFQTEVPNKESGTVIAVSKIGYRLKERTIRPACVGVAKSSRSPSPDTTMRSQIDY